MKRHFLAAFLAAILSLSLTLPSVAARPKKVFLNSDTTLTAVTFVTTSGLIRCNLPPDIRPGDTISGAIQLEPKGSSDRYKKRAESKLNDYILMIGDHEAYVRLGTFRFEVPKGCTGLNVRLTSKKGKELASQQVPLSSNIDADKPEAYSVSKVVEANKPVKITGDFTGDFRMSTVTINDQNTIHLAESPRSLVFQPPENMSGTLKLKLKEGNKTLQAKIVALSVSLSMVTTTIAKGKSHSLLVRIVGLKEGVPSVMVKLKNLTPKIVNVEGGDVQSVGAKSDTGTWELRREVRGNYQGRFKITAHLVPSVKKVDLSSSIN